MKRAVTRPYRELFAAPGTTGFALAGLLARLPLPMTGIGLITLLAQVRGSYALAGAVAATFVLTYALLSPQVSRLVGPRSRPYYPMPHLLRPSSVCRVCGGWPC